MHQLFYISELIDRILLCLRDEKDYASLARIARTCKTLEDPSLDILWYHQDNLVPLLLVMYPDVPEMHSGAKIFEDARTSRENMPIFHSDNDESRLAKYAHKIHEFCLCIPYNSLKFHRNLAFIDAVEGLLNSLGGVPFPELRTLAWPLESIPVSSYDLVTRFLGPNLASITFHYTSLDESALDLMNASIVQALNQYSPPLQKLRMDNICNSNLTSCVIQSFRTLQIVSLRNQNGFASWFALAQLPNLIEFTCSNIALDPIMHPSSLHVPSIDHPFASLKTLKMSGDIPEVIWMLSFFKLPAVSSLDLRLDDPRNSRERDKLLLEFSSNLSSIVLQSHKFSLVSESHDAEWKAFLPPLTLTSQVIRKFTTCFPNMIEFAMGVEWKFDVDDESIHHLTKSWPYLKELMLDPMSKFYWNDSIHRPTFNCLKSFASHCLQLNNLSIYLDSSDTDIDYDEVIISESPLKSLDVGESSNPNPTKVAHYLTRLFPNLEDLGYSSADSLQEELDHDEPDEDWGLTYGLMFPR
ncbi:hypothetical protein ABKN59_008243 [Abortiporus biennis]